MKTVAVLVFVVLVAGFQSSWSSPASHSEFYAEPLARPEAKAPRPDDLLALMEAVTRGHGRLARQSSADGANSYIAGSQDPKLRGTFAQVSDIQGIQPADQTNAESSRRAPRSDVVTGLLQTPELERDISSSINIKPAHGVRVQESSEPESSEPDTSSSSHAADEPEQHALLQLGSTTQEHAEPASAPAPADDGSDDGSDCSKLSASDAAAVVVGPQVRIVMLVLTACFAIGAAILAKLCLAENTRIRARCPALLLSQAALGLIILAVLSIPVEISDLGVLASLLQWTEIVGVPAVILIDGVRLLHCRAQFFLYMKRRALVGTTSAPKPSRRASLPSIGAAESATQDSPRRRGSVTLQSKEAVSTEESAVMMKRAKALAAESRFTRHLAVFVAPLLVAGVMVQLFVSSCTVLGGSAMAFGIAVGLPAFAAICAGLVALVCTRVADGYLIKIELFVVVLLDLAFAVAQLVVGLMHPGASNVVVGLLQTYRVGIGAWLVLGMLARAGFAMHMHWPTSDDEKGPKFDAIFDQPQLRQHFEEQLHRSYAGGLMMLWEEIQEFRAKFTDADEPKEAKPEDATPQANLRRDTVRKAKLGLAARAIWHKYLVVDAPMEMEKLDPLLRDELSNRINCNTISHLMFDAVQEIAFEEMRAHFKRFTVPVKDAVYAEL